MNTFQNLQEHLEKDDLQEYVRGLITDHKASDLYKDAEVAYDYYRRKNRTINDYQKFLYTIAGEAVPDNYSANFKFSNAFFPIFIKQEVSHLLGNGVTFNFDATKDRFGGEKFDNQLIKLSKAALWGAVAFGFFNLDRIDVFSLLEFVPLFDEENGALRAGIRFWQIDNSKPLRATLYLEDGYIEYMWKEGDSIVLKPKTSYKQITQTSVIDGVEIIDGENYLSFPIIPLWANEYKTSELNGLREKIDGYDLIESGFANDLSEASQIYWILHNSAGMQDADIVKFLERLHTLHGVAIEEPDTQVEAHTVEVPHEARMKMLDELRDSLFRDAMALDTDKISAGAVTATAIRAAYENLSLKCDDFEMCITDFIYRLLELVGIDDAPTFKRSSIVNMTEETAMILSAAQYLDDETILNHLPFLNIDSVQDILKRKDKEESERFGNEPEETEEEVEETKQ